jgi:hypothetical protein
MKKLHVSELTDSEFSAVFTAAAAEAVSRARSAGHEVPTLELRNSASKSALSRRLIKNPKNLARAKGLTA